MAVQFTPGDVVEIETTEGKRLVQITHSHLTYPEILRGFSGDGLDMDSVAKSPSLFRGMFPLFGALERGSIKGRKIGKATIPSADRNFPIFKTPIYDKNGDIAYWWFWDGDSLRYDAAPKENLAEIPRREVLTAVAFLEKLKQC